MPNGIPNNLLPYVSQVAAGKLAYLHVFGDDYPTPDGTGVRDYIHVVDLARGHIAAADFAMKHTGTEIINLGTGHGYSVLDIVKAFEKVNGVNPVCQTIDLFPPTTRAPHPCCQYASDRHLLYRVIVGWYCRTTQSPDQ